MAAIARRQRHVGGRDGQEAQKHKVSEQTIYTWRKHFGELAPRTRSAYAPLEAENARLKRLLAERDLYISVLKEINAEEW